MATNPTKLYKVGEYLVEGTRSEGGAFYDIKVVATGKKMRFLAEIFEQFATEVKPSAKNVEKLLTSQIIT